MKLLSKKHNPLAKLSPGFKQFLIKTLVFIGMFITFSFIVGQKIITSILLEGFKISIYGRIGYILLFSIAGFILIYRKRLTEFEKFKHKTRDFFIIGLSFVLLIAFYILELNIGKIPVNIVNIILVHLLFFSVFLSLILGVYGLEFVKHFVKKFKKEICYFLVFGIVMALLMNAVWSLWPYFSLVVLKVVSFLLKFVGNVNVINSNTLIYDGFAAQIAEACSGIYSIFIFTGLYLFAVFLDWKIMNKKKAIIAFVPAIIGAFLANILRVFLLMVVGAHVSREVALGLYHSYAGMLFFLGYFLIFWLIFYKWMKKK
jgi:exosortase/archaeosortase family protein